MAKDFLDLEGRTQDGWAFGLRLSDGNMVRVCDSSGPEGVWARIEQARPTDGYVFFSGARASANGKLEGLAFLRAKLIDGLFSYGPGLLGITEARLADMEAGLANMGERMAEAEASLDELEGEDELPEGSVIGPNGEIISPLPTEPVAPEVREAITAGASADEEG